MAQESCNLDKDKSDLLTSSSSSSSSSSSPPAPTIAPPPQQSTVIPKTHNEEIAVCKVPEPTMTSVAEPVVTMPDKPGKDASFSGTKLSCNRCLVCNRKVGIPGFRCRCGELFCAKHRYSDKHDCSYDYKSAGREEIARANPLIRASKIIKI